jgi:putative membrane protein
VTGLREVMHMCGLEFSSFPWWIFPILMIIFCIFFMRRGCGRMMCGFSDSNGTGESAIEILNKRHAKGELDQREYEEKKGNLGTLHT